MSSPHPPGQLRRPSAKPAPHSVLAIIALILAVVPCCPVVPMVGSLLGGIAHYRIVRSARPVRGRRTARVAIFAGLGMTLLTSALSMWMSTLLQGHMRNNVARAVARAVDPAAPVTGLDSGWLGDVAGGPSTEEIQAFRTDFHARYGTFRGFSVSSVLSASSIDPFSFSAPGIFDCGQQSLPGNVQFRLVPGVTSLMPSVCISAVHVQDAAQGDLRSPPAASQPVIR